jgi:hypothetical protein
MQKLLFMLTALVCSSYLLAAKTYTFTLSVKSLATDSPLSGLSVTAMIKDEAVKMGQTDSNGELVMAALKEKSIKFIVTDPSKTHREHTLYIYNPKKEDQIKAHGLRLNEDKEDAFFEAWDARYPAQIDKDSVDYISASPVDGVAKFYEFIFINLEVPNECLELNIQGKVYLTFLVQKDGTITHVAVEKGLHPSIDAEATRVLRYAPKWNPATSGGKPVVTLMRVPIVLDIL